MSAGQWLEVICVNFDVIWKYQEILTVGEARMKKKYLKSSMCEIQLINEKLTCKVIVVEVELPQFDQTRKLIPIQL